MNTDPDLRVMADTETARQAAADLFAGGTNDLGARPDGGIPSTPFAF